MSFQGRRFETREFPCPFDDGEPWFKSRSRCLVDLGRAFLVVTEGDPDGPPHHRGLFRLEVQERSQIEFADDSIVTKADCASLLDEQLDAFPHCDISKIEFPFFVRGTLSKKKYKPCLTLYGENTAPLYIAVYNGAPDNVTRDWEMVLQAPQDIAPNNAPTSVLDLSKICVLPTLNTNTDHVNCGLNTFSTWYLDPVNKKKAITCADGAAMRRRVVAQLHRLLQTNPRYDYFDSTIKQDIGTWVYDKVWDDKEGWCYNKEKFALPPGMSADGVYGGPTPEQETAPTPERETAAAPARVSL